MCHPNRRASKQADKKQIIKIINKEGGKQMNEWMK